MPFVFRSSILLVCSPSEACTIHIKLDHISFILLSLTHSFCHRRRRIFRRTSLGKMATNTDGHHHYSQCQDVGSQCVTASHDWLSVSISHSVISLLNTPNFSSPANVDASVRHRHHLLFVLTWTSLSDSQFKARLTVELLTGSMEEKSRSLQEAL